MKPMTLGALLDELKKRPQAERVRFDFGGFGFEPGTVSSYRGYYEMLAIGYDGKYDATSTVAVLVAELTAALGRTFTGYKGGEYRMHSETLMWAANYSECHQTAITGLADCEYETVLATSYCDDPY